MRYPHNFIRVIYTYTQSLRPFIHLYIVIYLKMYNFIFVEIFLNLCTFYKLLFIITSFFIIVVTSIVHSYVVCHFEGPFLISTVKITMGHLTFQTLDWVRLCT